MCSSAHPAARAARAPPFMGGTPMIREEPMVGLEPTTPALRKPCSTVELHRRTRIVPTAKPSVKRLPRENQRSPIHPQARQGNPVRSRTGRCRGRPRRLTEWQSYRIIEPGRNAGQAQHQTDHSPPRASMNDHPEDGFARPCGSQCAALQSIRIQPVLVPACGTLVSYEVVEGENWD